MAKCEACGREMLIAPSCDPLPITDEGKTYARIPYGEGTWFGKDGLSRDRIPERCGDCGVKLGGYHHPGCDREECPVCHEQRMGCDCGRQ